MKLSREGHQAREVLDAAVASTEDVLRSLRERGVLSVGAVEGLIVTLLEHLEVSDALLAPLLAARERASGPARQAVHVAVLSLRIGTELGWPRADRCEAARTALLHQAGDEGLRVVRASGSSYARVAMLVRQVRERLTSAARAAAGPDDDPVHVVALAAAYEAAAALPTPRPNAWPPEALKEVLRHHRTRFPDTILKALIRITSTFPLGALVRLSTGEVACVVAKNPGSPLRPIVAVQTGGGRAWGEPRLVDLRDHPFLYVQEFLGSGAGEPPEEPAP